MKIIFFLTTLFIFYFATAQPSQQDIIKFKIKKITVNFSGGARGQAADEYYYDEKGNDTAKYSDGSLQYRKKYEFDNKNHLVKIISYGADNETETTTFTYKPDGSYITENKDKEFRLVNKEFYDKKGNKKKSIIPDGSQYSFFYDKKGRLIKISPTPKNGGIKITTIHTYNVKGQLISTKTTGDYSWSEKNFYDAKGLLIKTLHTGTWEGQKEIEESKYSYEFR